MEFVSGFLGFLVLGEGALDFGTNVNSLNLKYVLNQTNLLAALCPMAPREKALSLFSLMCLGVNPDIVDL